MITDRFNDLIWFLVLAEELSFTRAAAKIGISQSTLSHTIKRVETKMGVRLLTRTTRSVALTEAGMSLQQSLAPRLTEIETEIASLMEARDQPAGIIRISLSDYALNRVVWPKLSPILGLYPEIKVELSINNGFCNIVEGGFDAGIRRTGKIEQDMIAVRIGAQSRRIAVASPDYFARHAPPEHPKDLADHNCINQRWAGSGVLYAWEFEEDGRMLRVRVDGQLTFSAMYPMVKPAVDGLGIAYVPEDMVSEHLASGALVQVLDKWSPKLPEYCIYYPSRRQNRTAFNIIVDALRI